MCSMLSITFLIYLGDISTVVNDILLALFWYIVGVGQGEVTSATAGTSLSSRMLALWTKLRAVTEAVLKAVMVVVQDNTAAASR